MPFLLYNPGADIETDFKNKTNETKVVVHLNLSPSEENVRRGSLERNWSYYLMRDWRAL